MSAIGAMRTRRDAIRQPANAEGGPSRQDAGFEFEFMRAWRIVLSVAIVEALLFLLPLEVAGTIPLLRLRLLGG
jgi:hypothetical protein